jgi:arginine deiminase
LNPSYWPARYDETMLMKGDYRFHPDLGDDKMRVWCGDPELVWPIGGDTSRRSATV